MSLRLTKLIEPKTECDGLKNNLSEVISNSYHHIQLMCKQLSTYLDLNPVPFHSQSAIPLIIGFQLVPHALFHKSKDLTHKTENQRHTFKLKDLKLTSYLKPIGRKPAMKARIIMREKPIAT